MTTTQPELAHGNEFVDDFLRLVAFVRGEKPRDPLRRLEDLLLELRLKVD